MAFVEHARKRKIISPEHESRLRLKTLLSRGLPPLQIIHHPGRNNSKHTSGHEPMLEEKTNLSFGLIGGLIDNLAGNETIGIRDSMFLRHTADEVDLTRNTAHYTNVADLQSLVGNLLLDLIALCDLKDKLSITLQTYVPHAKYFGRANDNYSDFYVIFLTETGRPLLVVSVKSPRVKDVLLNDKVLGQICDYMIDVASFYGQHDVFGITTTVTDWKVHWFEHSDKCAAANDFMADESELLAGPPPTVHRALRSTRIYQHHDPDLIHLLLSVLGKSYTSGYHSVPLIDPHRLYVRLTADGWSWRRMAVNNTIIQALTIDLNISLQNTTKFTVLRHFVRSREQLVWLAIASESANIVVIKQYEIADSVAGIPEREAAVWREVNQCKNVFTSQVRGLQALITPLVFTASIDAQRRVSFASDLARWCCQDGGLPGALPECLEELNQQIRSAFAAWPDARVVAYQALQKLANKRIVHTDIEWRHVALLPVFSNGVVVRLEPVTIDFAEYHVVDSAAAAMEIMMPKLEKLIAATVWE